MFEKNIKIISAIILTAVIAGGVGFFTGKSMGVSKSPVSGFSGQFAQGMPGGVGRTGTSRMEGDGFVTGEVIAKDDTSITVKTRGGQAGQSSSKIVFLSGTTEVTKSVTGAVSDLVVGQSITTTGTTNPDGSITAKTVQIRPTITDAQKITAPGIPQ